MERNLASAFGHDAAETSICNDATSATLFVLGVWHLMHPITSTPQIAELITATLPLAEGY